MIIHIFPKEKFTIPFINFINNNFSFKEHIFLIFGESDVFDEAKIQNKKNVQYFDNYCEIKNIVSKGNLIIFHSMPSSNNILKNLFFKRRILKKSVWVIWGGDLYTYRKYSPKKIKEKVINMIRKFVYKNFAYIATLVEEDYKIAKETFHVKGKYLKAIYINPIKIEDLEEFSSDFKKVDEVNIQIGNSATITNNHKEIIDILVKFKDYNIKVFVPLSYPKCEYANIIAKYGKEKLGEKFIPILDFMPSKEYTKYLANIDIAIFNNNRQQALGNIFALAYLKCKIYMRDDVSMWKQFNEDGYKFDTIKTLKNCNYEQFIFKDDKKIINNQEISKNRFDEKYISKIWESIFNLEN